jgi:hypothetical protein
MSLLSRARLLRAIVRGNALVPGRPQELWPSTLHAWLRLYLRLGLDAAMVGYGVAKLLTGQFAATPSFALLRTY